MTDDLKPCPFCGGGITTIEGGGQTWRGVNGYSDPQFYHLRHFGKLSETDDFPRCFVEFRCRTEAEAIAAWNTRALTEQLEAVLQAAKPLAAMAERYDPEDDDGDLECWSGLAVPKIKHIRALRTAIAGLKIEYPE
jgi:hypothetical protein